MASYPPTTPHPPCLLPQLTLDAASPHFSTAATPWECTWDSNLLLSSLRPSDTRDTNVYIRDKSVGVESEGGRREGVEILVVKYKGYYRPVFSLFGEAQIWRYVRISHWKGDRFIAWQSQDLLTCAVAIITKGQRCFCKPESFVKTTFPLGDQKGIHSVGENWM